MNVFFALPIFLFFLFSTYPKNWTDMALKLEYRPVAYRPQAGFQVEVHKRLEDIVTLGGKRGPGKTQALIGESLRDIDNPHYHGAFFRREYPRLQEVIDRCQSIYGLVGGKWQGDIKRFTFPRRSIVDMFHLENEEDKAKHLGKEYSKELFDQLEEFTETQFDYMLGCNRTSWPGLRCSVWASHNPGGVGNAWVNRRFVKGRIPGQTYTESYRLSDGRVATRTTVFIRGRLEDNQIMLKNNPSYEAVLAALPLKLHKAWVLGDYDALEGQFFDSWSSFYHIIKPFEIPSEWAIYQSLDWGYEKPLSAHWWAVPPAMDHVYCIREYYVTRKNSDVAAGEIHEISCKMFGRDYISSGRIKKMYSDPSIWHQVGRNKSGKMIAEDFLANIQETLPDGEKRSLLIVPADNSRVQGWNVFRKMLSIQPDGKPFAMWFETCENAIRTIPEMVHDKNKPEDLDTDGEDHCVDDSRYFFIERFRPNVVVLPQPHDYLKVADKESWQTWEAIRKKSEASSDSFESKILRMGA